MFCLPDHAGTVKIYSLNTLKDLLRTKGFVSEVNGTKVIAATLYEGGLTLHSRFEIGVDDDDEDSKGVNLSKYISKSETAALLRKVGVVMIDEVSILCRALFEFVDNLLQYLCVNELKFGRITVALSGDFLQLLVVVHSEGRDFYEEGNERRVDVNFVDEIPFNSKLWDDVKVLRVTHQVGERDHTSYGETILSVGKGNFTTR